MEIKEIKPYVFLVLLAIFAYLFWLVLKPFVGVLVIAAITVFLLYPLYGLLYKKTKRENLSAVLLCVLAILIIVIPSILVIGVVVGESVDMYQDIKDKFTNGNVDEYIANCDGGFLCTQVKKVLTTSEDGIREFLTLGVKRVSVFIIENGSVFVKGISSFVIQLFILILSMFYLFKSGDKLVYFIYHTMPMEKKYRLKILKNFKDIVHATFLGSIITMIIQAIIAVIGYSLINWLLGGNIPYVFLLATLTGLAAIVPIIGTATVWVPIMIIQFAQGNVGAGIAMIVFGAAVIGSVDNIVKPKVIGMKTELHPLLVFLSVFGGLAVFGFIGLIIGPLVSSVFVALLNIYKAEFR